MSLSGWTLTNVAGVLENTADFRYAECQDSAHFHFDDDASESARTFYCAWGNKIIFCNALVGYATFDSGSTSGISRTLPEPHPDVPLCFAYRTIVEPVGPASYDPDNNYAYLTTLAKVTVDYKYPLYQIVADGSISSELDRFVTRQVDPAPEVQNIDGGGFSFCTADSGQPKVLLKSSPPKLIGTVKKTIIWHDVPADTGSSLTNCPNYSLYRSRVGYVNSDTFDGDPPGTVLFCNFIPRIKPPRVADGTSKLAWEITFEFMLRNQGAGIGGSNPEDANAGNNYVYNPYLNTPVFDLVTGGPNAGTATGTRIYPATQFAPFFIISS